MTIPTFCIQCGASLSPDTAFCEQCGKRIQIIASAEPESLPPPPLLETPRANPRSGFRSLILLFIVVLAGASFYYLGTKPQPADPSKTQDVQSPPLKDSSPGQTPPTTSTLENSAKILPPVEVAYLHFMDEVNRRAEGSLHVGSPTQTATLIEVAVTAEGTRETVVVVEKSNDGNTAVVVVGPKDAGAIRSYTLSRKTDGWAISAIEDLDG